MCRLGQSDLWISWQRANRKHRQHLRRTLEDLWEQRWSEWIPLSITSWPSVIVSTKKNTSSSSSSTLNSPSRTSTWVKRPSKSLSCTPLGEPLGRNVVRKCSRHWRDRYRYSRFGSWSFGYWNPCILGGFWWTMRNTIAFLIVSKHEFGMKILSWLWLSPHSTSEQLQMETNRWKKPSAEKTWRFWRQSLHLTSNKIRTSSSRRYPCKASVNSAKITPKSMHFFGSISGLNEAAKAFASSELKRYEELVSKLVPRIKNRQIYKIWVLASLFSQPDFWRNLARTHLLHWRKIFCAAPENTHSSRRAWIVGQDIGDIFRSEAARLHSKSSCMQRGHLTLCTNIFFESQCIEFLSRHFKLSFLPPELWFLRSGCWSLSRLIEVITTSTLQYFIWNDAL